MLDVVLLELEGVLFETWSLRHACLRDVCATHGIADAVPDSPDAGGLTVKSAAARALNTVDLGHDRVLADLIVTQGERLFSSRLATRGVALRAGAREFIDRLAGAARLGVVTRMRRGDVDVLLRLSGLDSAFSSVVCGDDLFDEKPSPHGYELSIERLGRQRAVPRRGIVALEDGIEGIRAARAAKVRCVAVGPLPVHVAIEADAYITALEGHTAASLDTLSSPGRERV